MKLIRAYKTELDPNDVQRTALLQHAGAARWAYNFGLRRKIAAYEETGKSPSAIDLHRELNALKKTAVEQGGVPWMYEVSKAAPQEALRNLDKAFQHFFRRCKGNAKVKGFPKFKSRKRGIGSFTLTGAIRVGEKHVQLPRLGKLRCKEHGYLPETGVKILSATVSACAGRWFVSLQVEQEAQNPCVTSSRVVGVDVGIASLAITSDAEIFENPRALRSAEVRLRRLQRSVSRKVKGSRNRKKAIARVAVLHYRVSNVRKNALHQASNSITKNCGTVVLETLNIAGMVRNSHLAKALSDVSLAEFHRQIEYKARWRGVRVIRADRWFPSSKMCSACGGVCGEMPLSVRRWTCQACGVTHDRDVNAAVNLRNLAVSSTVSACGDGSADPDCEIQMKLPSVKQELNADRGLSSVGLV